MSSFAMSGRPSGGPSGGRCGHALAHVGRWQGRRARYRGTRKNLFDLRRCAVVHNLHVIARLPQPNAA